MSTRIQLFQYASVQVTYGLQPGRDVFFDHDGEVLLDGVNMLELEPDERAAAGLFLAFQYPIEIPGVVPTAHDALSAQEMEIARLAAEGFSNRVFKQLKGFGSYGFPESHAASFALLVYVSSYLKCYYPDVFAGGLLNSMPMGFYQPAQIIIDAKKHGVAVLTEDEWLKLIGE